MTMNAGDVPRQLPSGPRRFVNRDSELAAVGRLLADAAGSPARVAVCTGLPGVGKTSLVRTALERHGGGFPGGELLVEFGEPGNGGISVGDALASCLIALGVAESVIPSRLADRAGLYRTRTSSRPLLVVLDDVTDPAQVGPLVPSASGSLVLVTSTARLTELRLDGAELVDVEPLDAGSGAQMVRDLCGPRVDAEPDAVARLVDLCGGLPLALRAAAARLIARASLSVADLVAEIADERRGLEAFAVHGRDQIMPVFTVAYRQLPEPAARMYRLLSVLPGPDVTVELATHAGAIDQPSAAASLERLVEAGLLQEGTGGRFHQHSLVRRHAKECALAEDPEPVRVAAVRRAMEHLLTYAAYADLAVLGPDRYRCTPHDQLLVSVTSPFGGPDPKPSALRWLDAERGNLAAGVRACVERGWHHLAWQLAEAATALYVHRRYLIDWTDTSDLGATAAGLAGHAAAEARLRSFASRPWTELGDPRRARAELDAAFSLVHGTSDARLLASIHEMDGRYYDAVGDPAAAATAFGRAVELFDRAGDRRGVAFVSYFLGCAQQQAGDLGTALSTLEDSLEEIRAVGDSRMIGRALSSIAEVLSASGDDLRARARLDEAITVLTAGGDLFYEARARETLAGLALRTGELELARECLRRARDVHLRLGSPRADELERRLIELSRS